MVGVDQTQVEPVLAAPHDHLGGAPGDAGQDGVEEGLVDDLDPRAVAQRAASDRGVTGGSARAIARRPSGPW